MLPFGIGLVITFKMLGTVVLKASGFVLRIFVYHRAGKYRSRRGGGGFSARSI